MEELTKLKNELECEMNADFIDWKKYYELKEKIMELENANRSNFK